MAPVTDPLPQLDMREQLARIAKMQAELQNMMWETVQQSRPGTLQLLVRGAIGVIALIGAGALLATLF